MPNKTKPTTMAQRRVATQLGPESAYCKLWGSQPTMARIVYGHMMKQHPFALDGIQAATCEEIASDHTKLEAAVAACDDEKDKITGERYLANLGRSGMVR